MDPGLERAVREANWSRYRPGQTAGHYESFFVRANHPQRPLAFWIRYTIFSPAGRPADALGELWAIYFDGEAGAHLAVKREVPLAGCSFAPDRLGVAIDGARLTPGHLSGSAATDGHTLRWDLAFGGDAAPIFLLPLRLYTASLPRAKSLAALPLARFDGVLTVDGRTIEVAGWTGSQNHNWGSRHTDHYAWGQVTGFDRAPESVLEIATARLRFGPCWTPPMTPLVLRHRGAEIAVNGLRQTLRVRADLRGLEWRFAARVDRWQLDGWMRAPAASFVGLRYRNPPGGTKHCLNSKLAACEITLTDTAGGDVEVLSTTHRAAFEILTDDASPYGIALRV